MKKYFILYYSAFAVTSLFLVSSCNKDEDPPKAGISFDVSSATVKESAGIIQVKVNLDKPLTGTTVLNYTLGGTAVEYNAQEDEGDYILSSNSITIATGATEATISIELVDDFELEDDETIILTLTTATGNAQVITANTYTLTIEEDDLLIELSWDAGDGTPGDVDMDLFVWQENPAGSDEYRIVLVRFQEGQVFEKGFIPSSAPDGLFGFSYVYYGGSSDEVDFQVKFTNLNGTVLGTASNTVTFEGTYTLNNIHEWTEETISNAEIVQLVEKEGMNYPAFSDIFIPSSGSRTKTFRRSVPDYIKLTPRGVNSMSAKKFLLK